MIIHKYAKTLKNSCLMPFQKEEEEENCFLSCGLVQLGGGLQGCWPELFGWRMVG